MPHGPTALIRQLLPTYPHRRLAKNYTALQKTVHRRLGRHQPGLHHPKSLRPTQ